MARIAGVDLPAKKRAEIGLTYIYGIGRTRALSLLYRAGVDAGKKVADLTEDEVNKIRTLIENEGAVEGDLRKEISMNIKRLIEMGSYRGCGIAGACRCAASGRIPTPARVKVRGAELSPIRRRRSAKT